MKRLMSVCFLLSILVLVSVGCFDCASDVPSEAPSDLLRNNELVMLGRFIGERTLARFPIVAHGDTLLTFVAEYRFVTLESLIGQSDTVNLWIWLGYELDDLPVAESGESLVYGRRMQSLGDLKQVVLGHGSQPPGEPGNAAVDSFLNRVQSQTELLRNLQTSIVIAVTDRYAQTFVSFAQGNLCFYPGAWGTKTLSSEEYMAQLRASQNRGLDAR